MRHGRRSLSNSSHKLPDIFLIAFVTKTLSESGTRSLNPNSFPISESLVTQILRNNSLPTSKRLDFFRWCSSLRHLYKHTACTYSHMLKTTCRAGFLADIPSLLTMMKEDNVVVDSETFRVLLDTFIRSGKFDVALEILDFVESSGLFNSKVYDSVLVALVRKNQLGLALNILLRLLEGCNGGVDSLTCNELLVALRKSDMKTEFKRVFDKLREKEGFEMDTWGYNICIHAIGCWGDLATSLQLFEEMKEKKSSDSVSSGPDLCTYNSLIHVLCLVGKVKDALIVYEELKVSGHEPDAFTYRTIIQGCCKSYRMEDAIRIFSELQYNGFLPDTVVYNSVLDGMFKARKVMEACQLFEKMVEDGVRASCCTYNILIDGLFRNGRGEAGYTLFSDLKKKGQFVDAITYSIVILQLCRAGQLDEALGLLEEMESRGLVVDLVTITSLVIGFQRQGRWDWTEKLMKHVRDGNLVPNVLKWKTEMEASMKSPQSKSKDSTAMFPSKGNFIEIMDLIGSPTSDLGSENKVLSFENDRWSSSPYMDQLASQLKITYNRSQLVSLNRGRRVQARGVDSFDIDMGNTFLSIFLAKGKLSLACKLFEIFRDTGVGSYTYNSMMGSFVKKGYFNEAWGVLNEMGEKICPADIATYNLIIQGLGKMGRADLASMVLDKLTEQDGYLDIVMYNTLINVLGKAGRISEANKLFEQMKSSGVDADVVTYNTLIEVHSKAGHLKDAYKFLKMMLDAGCLPNHVTDTILDFLALEIEKQRYQKASILRSKDDDS